MFVGFITRARVAKQQYLHPVFLYFCDIPFMRFTKASLRFFENCFLNNSQHTFKIVHMSWRNYLCFLEKCVHESQVSQMLL